MTSAETAELGALKSLLFIKAMRLLVKRSILTFSELWKSTKGCNNLKSIYWREKARLQKEEWVWHFNMLYSHLHPPPPSFVVALKTNSFTNLVMKLVATQPVKGAEEIWSSPKLCPQELLLWTFSGDSPEIPTCRTCLYSIW